MSRLKEIDRANWEEFVSQGTAVLMLGKSDCQACREWTEELVTSLNDESFFEDVQFGKLLLDQPGLGSFKKANQDWLADVDVLPFNLIYKDGEIVKSYAGGGLERLTNRLQRVSGTS